MVFRIVGDIHIITHSLYFINQLMEIQKVRLLLKCFGHITTFYFSITLLETSLPWIMFSYIVFSSVAVYIFYVVTHFL